MNRDQTIRYGMFLMPIHDPAKPMAQCYDEDLELINRCEDWGFDEFWVGEHHSSNVENIVMPEIFLGKAFGQTERIRLGPAPVCLQFHHPFQVASRLAFLDHLSHGRLNLCFGVGTIPSDLELHDVDQKLSSAMVAESIDMILKLWNTDAQFEIMGQFWNFSLKDNIDSKLGVGHIHKPLQRPHPPIAVPCISRGSASIKMAAEKGFQPFSHHMLHREVLQNQWNTYAQAAENAGRPAHYHDWKISMNVFVADSTEEARRLARDNSVGGTINFILKFTQRFAGHLALFRRDPDMSDADCNLDYFMREVIVVGDPDEVTRQIVEIREEVGPFGTLVLVAHDWDDKERHIHSLELFAKEVMPALNQRFTRVG